MSAEILLEAAALMRERAAAATLQDPSAAGWYAADEIAEVFSDGAAHPIVKQSRRDAEHIASWHPAVALATADWLDTILARNPKADSVEAEPALAVARAYLGGDE